MDPAQDNKTDSFFLKLIQWGALLACAIIVVQVVILIVGGEALCLNEGCKIVEQLTTIPPLFFNLIGLIYFFLVFLVSRFVSSRPAPGFDWLRVLLLAGLAAEGVLMSYQLFVVKSLCSYCLLVFSFILACNLLYGRRQALIGVPLFLVVLGAFSSLNFGPTLLILQNRSLGSGSIAVKKCATPVKKLYLFFSSDCPHCINVLKALENCNSCEFHFNPIDRIQDIALPDLEYTDDFEPGLNRLILSLLGIETIPVLLVENLDGFTFIKGEKSIVSYISQTCFRENPLLYMDSSQYLSPDEISVYDEQEGECTIQLDCPEESLEQPAVPTEE